MLTYEERQSIRSTGIIPDHLLSTYLSDKLLVKPYTGPELSDAEAYLAAKARLNQVAGDRKVDNTKNKKK